jgi:F0F1-type ATP synthase membrane subunit a
VRDFGAVDLLISAVVIAVMVPILVHLLAIWSQGFKPFLSSTGPKIYLLFCVIFRQLADVRLLH